MVVTVRYQGPISAYHAAVRVDSAFSKDCLTGFNILVEGSGSVVFGLVFNDPDKQPDMEYLVQVLQDGELIEPELQGGFPVIPNYAMTFLGYGFPLFKAYIKSYLKPDPVNNNHEQGGN